MTKVSKKYKAIWKSQHQRYGRKSRIQSNVLMPSSCSLSITTNHKILNCCIAFSYFCFRRNSFACCLWRFKNQLALSNVVIIVEIIVLVHRRPTRSDFLIRFAYRAQRIHVHRSWSRQMEMAIRRIVYWGHYNLGDSTRYRTSLGEYFVFDNAASAVRYRLIHAWWWNSRCDSRRFLECDISWPLRSPSKMIDCRQISSNIWRATRSCRVSTTLSTRNFIADLRSERRREVSNTIGRCFNAVNWFKYLWSIPPLATHCRSVKNSYKMMIGSDDYWLRLILISIKRLRNHTTKTF